MEKRGAGAGALSNLPPLELSLSLSLPPFGERTEKLEELFKREIEDGAASAPLPATRGRREGWLSEGGAKTAGKLFQSRSATIYKTMSYISPSLSASGEREGENREKEKGDKRFWESLIASRRKEGERE